MRSARTLGFCIIFLSALAMAQPPSSGIPTIEQPLAPTAAQPGGANFTLTITGTGFNQPTGVRWAQGTNVTQLTITSSTATQVKVSVPSANIATAGTASVSVLQTVSAFPDVASNVEFFQIASSASPQFTAPIDYSIGGSAESVLVGDFNGDGIQDLAVGVFVPTGGSAVCILFGNSNGTFQTPATCYPADNATSMVDGVFILDGGSLDIVAGDTYLENNGLGVFTANSLGTTGFIPYAVGDFSQSGELYIAGTLNGNVQILQSQGDGAFALGQNFATGTTQFGGMLRADFNGDGILDLAVLDSNPSLPVVRVFLGAAGTAGFSTTAKQTNITPALNDTVAAFTAGDFNGNGNQGLALVVTTSETGGEVLILNGNGDGTFTSGFSEALASSGVAIVSADFNEDGILDLAASTNVLLGNGDGTFQAPISDGGTTNEIVLATGDFNGDGRPDIAAEDIANNSVAVILQQAAAPVVSLKPTSVNFGSQTVGTSSAQTGVTIIDTGTASLGIESITITGTNASEFSVINGSCSASLAPAASCTFDVSFSPTAVGAATASVSIADDAAGSPQTVALTGTGLSGAPGATLAPSPVNFTTIQLAGTSSAAQSVTLTNNGSATLTITSIGFTGTNASEFAVTSSSNSNNCGTSLAAAASCTINITFTPTGPGAATASLSIADNAAGSPQTVPLTATAQSILTTSCTSLTVVPGQSAVFTVDLAPVNNFAPSVSLSCKGMPALGTCTVSPNSVTPDNGSTTAQVTAATTAATGSLRSPFGGSNGNRVAGLLGLTGITGLAALVMLPGKRRVKPRRRLCLLLFVLCMLANIATLPSCGGGTDPPGTATGTYPLTVTGTFTSPTGTTMTETVSFDLVVQPQQ